eukprot:ANDGO_03294.mRNA.1 Ataxin-2 homolog
MKPSSAASGASADRFAWIAAMLIGRLVEVRSSVHKNAIRGLLVSIDASKGLLLNAAVEINPQDLSSKVVVHKTVQLAYADVLSLSTVEDVALLAGAESRAAAKGHGEVGVDSEIGSKRSGKGYRDVDDRFRNMQKWDSGAPVDASLGSLSGSRSWDQFKANEERFGVRSNYEESLYTTALDRDSEFYKKNASRASKIEAEILANGGSDNVHLREERGLENEEIDEEERYGAVIRNGASGPSSNKKSTPATASASSASTPSAAAPSAVTQKSASQTAAPPSGSSSYARIVLGTTSASTAPPQKTQAVSTTTLSSSKGNAPEEKTADSRKAPASASVAAPLPSPVPVPASVSATATPVAPAARTGASPEERASSPVVSTVSVASTLEKAAVVTAGPPVPASTGAAAGAPVPTGDTSQATSASKPAAGSAKPSRFKLKVDAAEYVPGTAPLTVASASSAAVSSNAPISMDSSNSGLPFKGKIRTEAAPFQPNSFPPVIPYGGPVMPGFPPHPASHLQPMSAPFLFPSHPFPPFRPQEHASGVPIPSHMQQQRHLPNPSPGIPYPSYQHSQNLQ